MASGQCFNYPNTPILQQGAAPNDFSGDYMLGPYAVETTQRYVYGTRYIMWDGRVFKYANAVAQVRSYQGCCAAEDAALSYTVAPVASSVGSKIITATVASRSEDDFAGGYVVIYNSSVSIDNTCVRGIVANEATVSTTTRMYVDFPLDTAITTSDYLELYENPYRELSGSTNSYAAWMGVPATSAAATYKFWVQTFGPALISGGESIDSPTADYRCIRWGTNHSLYTEASKANGQIAGYILNQGSSSIAGPMIMLWCSI